MAPDRATNALSSARVALAGIDAILDTFKEDDHLRVHPIITRGVEVDGQRDIGIIDEFLIVERTERRGYLKRLARTRIEH